MMTILARTSSSERTPDDRTKKDNIWWQPFSEIVLQPLLSKQWIRFNCKEDTYMARSRWLIGTENSFPISSFPLLTTPSIPRPQVVHGHCSDVFIFATVNRAVIKWRLSYFKINNCNGYFYGLELVTLILALHKDLNLSCLVLGVT